MRLLLPIALLLALGSTSHAQTTVRASVDSPGMGHAGWSANADVSDDGRFVLFRSAADLAPLASNRWNLFVRDLQLNVTATVDVGPGGVGANGDAVKAVISGDGRYVAMNSEANNLVTPAARGIILRDRDPDADGVFDQGNEVNVLASRDLTGASPWPPPEDPAISADGRFVAYVTGAALVVSGDTNGTADIFVFDRVSQATVRVSEGTGGVQGNGNSIQPSLSATGRYVAFASTSTNFGAGHTGWYDIFRHDRDPDGNGVFDEGNGITILISPPWSGPGSSNNNSNLPDISANGDRIAFVSGATNLVPGFIFSDARIYLRVVSLGGTSLQSVNDVGQSASTHSREPSISPDGRFIAFHSNSANLVPNDLNGKADIFVRDTIGLETTRASLGATGNEADQDSSYAAISFGGQTIAFTTKATNLVPAGDTNGTDDVYARVGSVPSCPTASSFPFGAGHPGTLGVPSFSPSANPTLGGSFSLLLGNSRGTGTAVLLVVGTSVISLPAWGGTLHVQPTFAVPFAIPAGGVALPVTLPPTIAFCGYTFLLQALEEDPGASQGVALTGALSLTLGL